MLPKRRRRLLVIFLVLLLMGCGVGLILYGFNQNLHLYLTPTLLAEQSMKPGQIFRLGGVVKIGSLKREGLDVDFTVTDFQHVQKVHYHGITPDLFKEGGGVIAQGALNAEGIFIATSILAKHDENYKPPRVGE